MSSPPGSRGLQMGCRGFAASEPTRRGVLRAGAAAAMGLGLGGFERVLAEPRALRTGGPGRAKACILVFMWGGPSQLDTWDPKPEAPAEIRGSFAAIPTKTPGIFISEHFPRLAQQTDKLAIVRSMSHDDPAHLSTVHWLQTGHLAPRPNSDAAGPSAEDWPHLGSILGRVAPAEGAMPTSVILPWTVAHPAAPGGKAPGQHGGWLGKTYDPFIVEGDPNRAGFRVQGLGFPEGLSEDRLVRRRGLLSDSGALLGGAANQLQAWDKYQTRAFDAMLSAEARGAFEIEREDPKLRDRYGRHIHGQGLLLARRLVEAGVKLVTVNWHDDGQNFWDTHGENFRHLKDRLMPPADQGFSALLDDLTDRGMLDDTLVVWVGEFGRNPRINPANNGREHWPRCYSGVLAGGGVRGGQVYGSSDRWAAYPASNPVRPDDLAATMLRALGVDPETEINDAVGRPLKITSGRSVDALFG